MDGENNNSLENDSLKDTENLEATASGSLESPQSSAPVDALSRTPEELEAEQVQTSAEHNDEEATNGLQKNNESKPKKNSSFKKFLRKINVYFLGFLLLMVAAGIATVVNYLNSKKTPPETSIATQELNQDALKQLANTDATVGNSSQTLTIQGNAVVAGQALMRGNLNVAGNFQTGGGIQGPNLTISGSSNLGETQASNLQIAGNTAVQGNTTLRDLNVAGTSSFGGAMTASQITVTRLILSGNARLEVPNHISFTGPAPNRTVNSSVLGAGGSVSLNGSDTAGTVTINTGNNPSAGCFTRVNFNQAFASQPRVTVGPIGAAAGQTQYYLTRDNAGFSICTASPAPANQVFSFDYFVTY